MHERERSEGRLDKNYDAVPFFNKELHTKEDLLLQTLLILKLLSSVDKSVVVSRNHFAEVNCRNRHDIGRLRASLGRAVSAQLAKEGRTTPLPSRVPSVYMKAFMRLAKCQSK